MQDRVSPAFARIAGLFPGPVRAAISPVAPLVERLLSIDRLDQLWETANRAPHDANVFSRVLDELGVASHLDDEGLARIPASGPVVVVANHPFGLLEGIILANTLSRVRPDFKIMANSLVGGLPHFDGKFLFVNPFGGRSAILENRRPLRQALDWLRSGGMMAVFPAGEVAHLCWKERAVIDPPWNESVGRIIRLCGCAALPVFFEGSNSVSFHLAGVLHASLRTADLPRQLLNKRGRRVNLRIGRLIQAETLRSFPSDRDAIDYLRWRTDLLARRSRPVHGFPGFRLPHLEPKKVAVIVSAPENVLAEEIGRMGDARLAEAGDLEVYLAGAQRIPNLLREIGRLRELTFRQVGEGTGRAIDLDSFDDYYLHLLLWNRTRCEVAGAYRLGPTPDILPARGVAGLYSSQLFYYDPELFRRIGPAIELGRSFVRAEYQRQFQPLLLLWKGIARYVMRRPECPVLFGAVSVSNDYSRISRDLLVGFLQNHQEEHLARLVRPRHPYRPKAAGGWHAQAVQRFLKDVEELSDPIADVEVDGKGVPILIRQYMKVGGRILGFNLDPRFSNALDALILVDLRLTPAPMLARYMSKEGAAGFLNQWRAMGAKPVPAAPALDCPAQ